MINEQERRAAFNACPILADYLATALQDLQYSEMDAACTEERDERDTGTVYNCPDETFTKAKIHCQTFMRDCASHIEAALELEPGEAGFRYGQDWLSWPHIGATFYLATVGSGVTFTDNGDAPCLEAMAQYARKNWGEGLYLGDDGKAYW